jgi:hypothetical protein
VNTTAMSLVFSLNPLLMDSISGGIVSMLIRCDGSLLFHLSSPHLTRNTHVMPSPLLSCPYSLPLSYITCRYGTRCAASILKTEKGIETADTKPIKPRHQLGACLVSHVPHGAFISTIKTGVRHCSATCFVSLYTVLYSYSSCCNVSLAFC